ncbi:transporter [bacterium]|nr:transporter [bacterium]
MKVKKALSVLAFVALILLSEVAVSCDLCSIYVGIRPDDYKNSFGMVHRYRSFARDYQATIPITTLDKHGAQYSTEPYSLEEVYNSYDLWFKYFLNPRVQIDASMSFSDNYLGKNDSMTNSISGPGDLLILSKYQVYNSKLCNDTSDWIKRFTVGAGIKLPTGTYNKTFLNYPVTSTTKGITYGDPETILDPHLQSGSGSVDFILMMEGILMIQNIGINTNMSYKINTTNKNNFRFANRFNFNPSLFYVKQFKEVRLMPTIGAAYERSNRDKDNGVDYIASGGETLFGNFGLTFFYKKISIGTTYFTPLLETLYDNQLNNQMRLISELNYYF